MKRFTLAQPFLFAAFPIVSLYASNIKLVHPLEVLAPLAVVMVATAVLFFIAAKLLRDVDAAALVISAFWLLMFTYGRVAALLRGGGREPFVLLAWVLLFIIIVWGAVRWRGRLVNVAQVVSVVGVALVAMPLFTIGAGLLPRRAVKASVARVRIEPTATAMPAPSPVVLAAAAAPLAAELTPSATPSHTPIPSRTPVASALGGDPDIYYIILDGYARTDVLRDLYGYDNSEFLSWLAAKGFRVASGSRANYCQTYLSFASSLNMTYLDEVAAVAGVASDDRRLLQDMVRDSAVVRALRGRGYTYVALSTGYADAELQSADLYLTAPWSLSQFESGLINTTPISPLISLQYDLHRQRLLYAFDHLADAARMEGPVFTFAHIAAPHPPFVFDEAGGPITPNREFFLSDGSHYMVGEGSREEYVAGYAGQARYITAKAQAAIEMILERSPRPPIIILQADHGPGSRLIWSSAELTDLRERMSILNAYYLPGGVDAAVYDTITPVNSFRLVLTSYFSADYPLLEDRSYFSTWDRPYDFIEVPSAGTGP